jgi:imidazole glycerol-phosphate synthase subunit HisH
MTTRVAVVDYGIGNVFSVCNALKAVGADVQLTRSFADIRAADRLILPGVGAFARAMEAINQFGLGSVISEYVATGKPFLGICIGMQVLMEKSSEFGDHKGLGFIAGSVERVASANPKGERVRVPNIGWSTLREDQPFDGTPLSVTGGDAVYFVHSYHCQPSDEKHLLASVDYDGVKVTAAIRRDNIMGVQFHPERSGPAGKRILDSFVNKGIGFR